MELASRIKKQVRNRFFSSTKKIVFVLRGIENWIIGPGRYNESMANLTLVYGMRLLPADEIVEVGEAPVQLKNGRQARVTMHVLEGSKEEIEKQLRTSLEAFFDFYPEI
jgi:hypothetical protein